MKVFKPIGSKERFLEMFQGVNKTALNEVQANAMQTGVQLVEKAFEELKNGQAQVKQTNTQTDNDENYVEIITNDENGNEITFTFKISSAEGDQDGVFNMSNAMLSKFRIKSSSLNVELPENMQAVQEFNQNHGSEIMDVVTQYADFETDTVSIDEDEVYQEAVAFIDKIPYKKGSEEIQTHKNYADNKPTNPEVRVDNDELQKFVKEMEDFVAGTEEEDDLLAMPPDFSDADMAAVMPKGDDDGATGVDPYDQEPEIEAGEASPEDQALFVQAYDNLVAAGNQTPNAVEIENEVNRLQGNTKPVEKTRAIPKGAEQFYESTDQDKFEDVVFMQGEEADEALEILRNQGEDAALQYLQQWHSPGQHMGSQELGHGSSDQTYEKDGYHMAWNFPLNYIGLSYELSGLDEEEEKTYPDPIGKKFKPKRQFPKKKKKITTDVKLSEESEIPQEYWGSPEEELGESLHGWEGRVDAMNQQPDSTSYEPSKNVKSYGDKILHHFELLNPEWDTESDVIERLWLAFINNQDERMSEEEAAKEFLMLINYVATHEEEGKFHYEKAKKYLMNKFYPKFANLQETEEIPDEKPEDGDFIEGGLADDADIAKYDPKQISMGIEVEMEHTDDPKVALEIAMDHLEEIPDYYTHLDKMEKEAGVEVEAEPEVEPLEVEGMGDNTPEDQEITDELLGYKPHNVGDYANEEFDVPQSPEQERQYWDKEYYRQDQEIEEPQDPDVGHADYLKQTGQMKSFDDASQKQEIIDEEGNFDEYAGEIGDRYEDANNNQFTVRDKVEGGVTLQGQGGEKEVATQDLQFLKKLSESQQIDLARQVLKNRRLNEGMTKKMAVQVLIKHNIK